jgi:FAD/FMN-containing dehydrogenase
LILSNVNSALSGTGLWYPVDPSSQDICTLGGSIATNAAGPSSLKYGTTRQNLASLRWLGASGEFISAGSVPVKTSMGFSLTDLLCGSEGRLGLILDATLRLTTEPPDTALLLAAFADEQSAVETIIKIRRSGIRPRSIEMLDAFSMQLAAFPVSKAGALLMIELDGDNSELTVALDKLQNLQKSIEWIAARDENSRRSLWGKRKSITLELKKRYPFKLGEDIAVPIASLATTVQKARAHAESCGIETAIWGHAGDGNLHVNYLLERENQLPQLEPLMLELARDATRAGGAMSGEHGLGRLKRKIARSILAPEYFSAQSSIKQAFDPLGIFNPALEEKQ